MAKVSPPTLSIVIPLFNEAPMIPLLFKRLNDLKRKLPAATECIFVDDGSTDGTSEKLGQLPLRFSAQIITLSRNFGHQAALLAGLQSATGQYVVTMDGDLQHPPELIPELMALHKQGYDVVLTKRLAGSEGADKSLTAKWFYWLINLLSHTKIQENASDFRSLNQTALKALLALPEQRKFLRGMVQWIGFKSVIVPYTPAKRVKGKSKYSVTKMLSLALHGLTSFSTRPLYLSGFFSVLLFVLAGIYACYVLYVRFFGSGVISGWASVLFMTLVIGGFLSLFIGLIGVYVAAIYDEVKKRPNFIISKQQKLG